MSEWSGTLRLAAYAALLVVVFGAAWAIGAAWGPDWHGAGGHG